MGLLTTTAKAARKLVDEWDEAAWLAENPKPDVPNSDPASARHRANKRNAKKRAGQEGYDSIGRKIQDPDAWDDSEWLANNPMPYPDIRSRDLSPDQLRERKNWIRRKANANPKNKEGISRRNKEWGEQNADKKKDYQAEYYRQNQERLREKQREYNEANRADINAKASAARADKEQKTPKYSNEKAINEIYRQAGLLSDATGVPYEVDHVIPLRGKKASGLHVPGNLMITPRDLNRSKHANFTPGDDPMRFNDVARQNIADANEMGLFSFLSKNADKAGLAGVAGVLAAGQSEDADAGLLHAGARGARDFTGRKPGDYKAPNLSKKGRSMPVVAQWSDELTKLKSVGADSHTLENKLLDYLKGDGSNSNLHNWPGFAKRIDGGVNGPFYLNGMDVFYEELVELMPQHEDIIRGVISRRQGGGKGRDFNKYESKHSAQNAQARNIGGGGVLDESAYQQKVRRAESDPNLRVPRYTDPIVRRNENTFVDPKTGRRKARQVSFAVGDPSMGEQYAQAQYDNYETEKLGQMQQLGLLADPMYDYGNLLPWKQNIVTGEGSPAVPDFLRTMLGGIFGVKSGLQQGIVNPNDLGDIFL